MEWPALDYLTRRYFKEEMEYLMVDGLLDGPLGYLAEYLVSVESVELNWTTTVDDGSFGQDRDVRDDDLS